MLQHGMGWIYILLDQNHVLIQDLVSVLVIGGHRRIHFYKGIGERVWLAVRYIDAACLRASTPKGLYTILLEHVDCQQAQVKLLTLFFGQRARNKNLLYPLIFQIYNTAQRIEERRSPHPKKEKKEEIF